MKFDSSMRVRGILDDAQQTLVTALLDRDSLTHGRVSSKALGRLHVAVGAWVPLHCRVHARQVRARVGSGDATTLGGDRVDVARSCHKDTSIFGRGMTVQKDVGS